MDNEISGQTGTHTTAMFWEYDSRLGRRWNTDPVIKEFESPYMCFSGNPIVISDLNGNDGIATVDKENKHISVNMTINYSKENFASDLAKRYGYSIDEVKSDLESMYGGTHTVTIGEETWTVDFSFTFNEYDTDVERDEATKSDKFSNKFIVTDVIDKNNAAATAGWTAPDRTIKVNPAGRREGTESHEGSHGLGLPETNPNTSYDEAGNPTSGPINSYAALRKVDSGVVYGIVSKVVESAKGCEENNVRVWIPGYYRFYDKETKQRVTKERPYIIIK
jgi:hypothetical protein